MKRGHSSDDIAVVDDTVDSAGPSDKSEVAETDNQRQHQKKPRRTRTLTNEQLGAINDTIDLVISQAREANSTDSNLGGMDNGTESRNESQVASSVSCLNELTNEIKSQRSTIDTLQRKIDMLLTVQFE